MTRDEILKMPAGEEIDKLVMWHLFVENQSNGFEHWKENTQLHIPCFSTRISAAWEVVYKLNEKWSITLDFDDPKTIQELKWYIGVYNNAPPYLDIEMRADTAPLAICRAALLAVMDIAQ